MSSFGYGEELGSPLFGRDALGPAMRAFQWTMGTERRRRDKGAGAAHPTAAPSVGFRLRPAVCEAAGPAGAMGETFERAPGDGAARSSEAHGLHGGTCRRPCGVKRPAGAPLRAEAPVDPHLVEHDLERHRRLRRATRWRHHLDRVASRRREAERAGPFRARALGRDRLLARVVQLDRGARDRRLARIPEA